MKILKAIAFLCASAAAINADEIVFDGNGDQGVIRLDTTTSDDGNAVTINLVSINEEALDPNENREITLVIPGDVGGKQVRVEKRVFPGKEAYLVEQLFARLNSRSLKLKIVFKDENGKKVQLSSQSAYLFEGSTSISEVDFRGADSSGISDAKGMFAMCINLKAVKFDNFNTSNIVCMEDMFRGCRNLESLELGSFDTSRVISMKRMFAGCSNLDLVIFGDNFKTTKADDISYMFGGCSNLQCVMADESQFSAPSVLHKEGVFDGCPNVKITPVS